MSVAKTRLQSRTVSQDGLVHPGTILAVRVLTIGAVGLAAYLLWTSLSGGAIAGCGPDSGCDKVLHSRWSRWLGLPVSALALMVYAAIFVGTFWLRRPVPPARQREAWRWLIPGAVCVIGAAVWFCVVQAFVLKTFCPFCMTAHFCGSAAAAVLLWSAPFRAPPEKPWQQEKQVFVPPLLGRKLVMMGLVGVVLLVAGQLVRLPRRQYMVKLFDDKVQMDLAEVPVIGSPASPHSIISLFDYTCHHCRIMHGHLMEAHHRFSNQLAIVSLPMPLCEKCNHTVKRTPKVHAQACDYARLGLAVWRGNSRLHPQFDDFMFSRTDPPALVESQQFASRLLGPGTLERTLKDPWIDQQIQRDISIYETNSLRGSGNMPQLIIGTNVTSGTFGQAAELFQLLTNNLGLK